MRASADRDEPRIGVLTPGNFSETYFEHATLARYLGFLLVEGDDLAVSGDRIHIRTVAGLKRLDVLLRRVDSNSLDPLELDASSHLGVPGLIDVLRKNGVVVANMPGSGVLEAAGLAGLPAAALSRRFFGEDLKMPHIATWWCGQKAAREEVLSRLDEVAIEGAYGRGVPGFESNGPVLAGQLPSSERERLIAAINERGIDFVGQELVRLSTMPVWDQGRIAPRPFVLRVFAAATPDGWTIMPGGFCRIAEQLDARAVSMGNGARAADVWVVSDKAVAAKTLLPASDTVRIRRIAGVLPSRAADNLFWLGRYLERAEATLRLVRALGMQQRDPGKGSSSLQHAAERVQRLLVAWGAVSQASRTQPAKVAGEALQAEERFGSALSLVRSAQRTATSLRERLSPDAWQVITEMTERLAQEVEDDDGVVSAAELTLQELASFAGLAQENMNRAAGWRFLEMGRRAERAINTVRFGRQFAYDEASQEDLDILLTLVDCQITYRSRYLVGPMLAPVRDLVVLDPYNPRSVAFQVQALNEHIASLPALKETGMIERPQRLAVAAAGDADDRRGGRARHQDAVRPGAGAAHARRRHRTALFPARAQCEPAGKAHGAGVIYDIRHVTTYAYESSVSFARCSLRLEPRSGDGQQLVSHSVDIRPRPSDRTVRRDFFGTHTESIVIEARASSPADRFPLAGRGVPAHAGPHRAEPGLGDRP